MQKEHLTHLWYWLTKAIWSPSGLKKVKRDPRNFTTEDLGWGEYEPKHNIKIIPTLSVKNQRSTNTCTWQTATVAKEVDEKCILSARSIVIRGIEKGLVKGNGYASLASPCKVLQQDGIMEASSCPDKPYDNWTTLTQFPIHKGEMEEHKDKTYYEVNSKDAKFRAIDEGHIVRTGMPWYTGYNGRYLPADGLIEQRTGYYVGGHAVALIGYINGYAGIKDNRLILDKNGKRVFVFQNSYGEDWGVKFEHDGHQFQGIFFVEQDFFETQEAYGSFVGLDIERSTGDFLKTYDGKNVRAKTGGGIYLISAGKKRVYPNWFTFLCWNPRDGYIQLTGEETLTLNELPDGDVMKPESSDLYRAHKKQLAELTEPKNLEKLLELLRKE